MVRDLTLKRAFRSVIVVGAINDGEGVGGTVVHFFYWSYF